MNQFLFPINFQSGMHGEFGFDMSERTFKGIGGVWDAKMWELLAREEPWKVRLKTAVGAPQTLVGEVPTLREIVDGFLGKKVFPFLVPKRHPETETCFVRLR